MNIVSKLERIQEHDRPTRRGVIRTGIWALAATAGLSTYSAASGQSVATPPATPVPASEIPSQGQEVAELAEFDTVMREAMSTWMLPGGQMAIAREGRLVFNRAYGYADVENDEAAEPSSLFRIASTSKPVTAVAVLALIDDGMLSLQDPVFPLLDLESAPNATVDPRLESITVQDLLIHAGGWDSALSFDPQYLPWSGMAASTLGLDDPAEAETIVRYMLGVPLDFDPGTQSVYSNFGFNVLGRVIEHASGQTYEAYVQDRVLGPAQIDSMQIGGTTLQQRAEREVRYYGPPDQSLRESVFPGEGYVPVGYGSYYMESLDAHGGWIASASDLVRFTLAIDGQRAPALLSPDMVNAMVTTPRPASGAAGAGNEPGGAGLGWGVTITEEGADWSHAGALEGSNASWLLRMADGTTVAFVFNSLPTDFNGFFGSITERLRGEIGKVSTWPNHDLFE